MARPPKPWFRASRSEWCVTLNGKHIRLGKDHSEAVREFHRLLSLEAPAEPGKLTTEVLIDRYLVEVRPKLASDTYASKRHGLQKFIDHYGRLKASDLRPFHVTAWLRDHDEWNPNTKRAMAAIVKAWSGWAAREGYLEIDRLRSVRVTGGKPRAPAVPGDFERILSQVKEQALRDILIVLGDTGCRPGEVRSLEASRCDWSASTAVVVGKQGKRTIGLTGRTRDVLRRYAAKYPNGPVLRNEYGNPWTKSTLKRRLDQACAIAGVAHFVPYHARHGYYSRAHRAGVDSVMIAKQLGHSDLKMLMQVYAHPDASQLADAAELAALLLVKPARARKAKLCGAGRRKR